MATERLLALYRQSVLLDRGAVHLERVCANGYLSEHLANHVAKGLHDPRVETADKIAAAGVPLERDREAILETMQTPKSKAKGGLTPGIAYSNEKLKGQKFASNQEMKLAQQSMHREFRA
eukprot:8901219-Pyramimonas_sp.AAC.1